MRSKTLFLPEILILPQKHKNMQTRAIYLLLALCVATNVCKPMLMSSAGSVPPLVGVERQRVAAHVLCAAGLLVHSFFILRLDLRSDAPRAVHTRATILIGSWFPCVAVFFAVAYMNRHRFGNLSPRLAVYMNAVLAFPLVALFCYMCAYLLAATAGSVELRVKDLWPRFQSIVACFVSIAAITPLVGLLCRSVAV